MKYSDAGVDVERGYAAVERIKKLAQKTFTPAVLSGIGGFGGLYELPAPSGEEPMVLVAGADGVGTKLKLAFASGIHTTVGIDCVAMCVNDILCSGAKPLFFLDYLATGKIDVDVVADVVAGVSDGCQQAGCALIGGETAEMPDFYSDGEYDIAGFSVGMVHKNKIIDQNTVAEGDAVIGLLSSGIHSNGYSLVRKLFKPTEYDSLFDGQKLVDVLLKPTRIYVQPVLSLLAEIQPHSMAHVTGGGFYENLPRAVPEDLGIEIYKRSWQVPEVFNEIQKRADISDRDMYSTFNMGIGFVVIAGKDDVDKVSRALSECDEKVRIIGRIKQKRGKERLWFA
jgi:phosphoribosylformylglycinamidine cyclo-ligase